MFELQSIEIVNSALAEIEPAMLKACLAKVADQIVNSGLRNRARIVISKRTSTGWLEYPITIFNEDHVAIYIVAIQRTVDSEVEFHS
jgi:hypothetical protein